MVLVITIPADADTSEKSTVTQSGDNSNQCVPSIQFGNDGENDNEQTATQQYSTADDIEVSGNTMTFSPELTAPCTPTIQQSSASSTKA